MDDAFLDIGRRGMRCRAARLEAAALVYGDIDKHGARLHAAHHLACHELRRGRPRHQHRADDEIGRQHLALDRLHGREERVELRAELHVELVEAGERAVDDGDISLHAHRHARRIGPRDTTAQDHHLGRGDAGDAAQEDTEAALLLFETMRADLDRHAAGDLAHRRQERQPTARIGDRLVSDAGGARAKQPFGLAPIGGEMEIGEEHLARPEAGDLGRLRLLDLDDHVGAGEDLFGGPGDTGACPLIGGIVEADARPRAGLDDDPVPVMDELAHASRDQPDPVFLDFHFFGDTDEHGSLDLSMSCVTRPRVSCHLHFSLTMMGEARSGVAAESDMTNLAILILMYLAVGAALFAQPRPGTAATADFTWRRQGEIFFETLPAVLAWPLLLWRLLRS